MQSAFLIGWMGMALTIGVLAADQPGQTTPKDVAPNQPAAMPGEPPAAGTKSESVPTQPPAGPTGTETETSGPRAPARPGRTSEQDVAAASDRQFLEKTAAELGIEPPSERIDLEVLRWFGARSTLEGHGIAFVNNWTVDYSKPLFGGANTRSDALRNLLDIRMNVDTRAAFGWYGGTFSVDFQNQAGRNGSAQVGDVQGFDNTDADGRTQVSELWYQQLFFDDRLRVKVGKVDANSEFAFPAYGAGFINSSFGHPPTITAMPTYPDPATSANIFFAPVRWFYAGAGIYDGSLSDGVPTGSFGPARIFHGSPSVFSIAEVGARWVLADNTLPGHVAVGGHYSDGQFDTFDGRTQSGTGGIYALAEQKLLHKNYYDKSNERGVYGFVQYGHADREVSAVTDYFGAGVTWDGPYEKAYPDTLGLGVAAARLTHAAGAGFTRDFETSIEAFYNFQVTPYLSIKPDLQYIINPGGDRSVRDALVATIRVGLAF
jgi:porin